MNKKNQFWALLKFQALINPFLFFFPLAISAPLWVTLVLDRGISSEESFESFLRNQNTFFVVFLGYMMLSLETRQGAAARESRWASGREFLLTRAVDRPLVLRTRVTLFYFLVVLVPGAFALMALAQPALRVHTFQGTVSREILRFIPGSVAAHQPRSRDVLTIPNGYFLMASWRLWSLLAGAFGTECLTVLCSGRKRVRIVFWVFYSIMIFMPTLAPFYESNHPVFFVFVAHQGLVWIATLVLLVVGHLLCERWFARVEQ